MRINNCNLNRSVLYLIVADSSLPRFDTIRLHEHPAVVVSNSDKFDSFEVASWSIVPYRTRPQDRSIPRDLTLAAVKFVFASRVIGPPRR